MEPAKKVVGKPFQPGQSGNPLGRPKRKPITDAIMRQLMIEIGVGVTNADKVAEHLVSLVFDRKDPRVALEAAKLVLAYVEGLPTQTVELDVYEEARRIAEERGLDPDRVIDLVAALKARRAG
jgi:hypothetical protein